MARMTVLFIDDDAALPKGLAEMSTEYKWEVNLGLIAAIWRGGCIIRAAFLDRIREGYEAHPDAPSLLLQSIFATRWSRRSRAGATWWFWRVRTGLPSRPRRVAWLFRRSASRAWSRHFAAQVRWSQDGTKDDA